MQQGKHESKMHELYLSSPDVLCHTSWGTLIAPGYSLERKKKILTSSNTKMCEGEREIAKTLFVLSVKLTHETSQTSYYARVSPLLGTIPLSL